VVLEHQLINNDNFPKEKSSLPRIIRVSANCLFVIAALSVVNSAIILFTREHNFYFTDFGVTAAILVLLPDQNLIIKIIVSSLLLFIIFIILGIQARKIRNWALGTGFFFYAADTLILILTQDWYSVVSHAIILYLIFRGFNASMENHEIT
jgi:hypothetical protein